MTTWTNISGGSAISQSLADQAAASASDASNSATAAATSATNSATSATASATSATASATSATASAASAASAAADLATFQGQYHGASATAPTTGLDTGDLYFDTVANAMKVYDGSSWVAAYISAEGVLTAANNLSDLSSASASRTNLGLAIGTDVQAYDAGLSDIAGLAVTDGNFVVGDGTNWVAESGATARTSLGLGTMATQAATSVDIDGGAIDGVSIGGVSAGAVTATTLTATDASVISASSSSDALRITQTGAGKALVVEDSTNPDSTPFVVDASGNVGIGTTSPSSKLTVQGTVTIGTTGHTYGAGALGFSNSDYGFVFRPPVAGVLGAHLFEAFDGTDLVTIENGGNVGIGTTAPSTTLDVSGTARATQGMPIITEAGTAKTLALTDNGGYVRTTSGSAVTITVPLNSSVAFPTGAEIVVFQDGAGLVTFAATGGVTIKSKDSNLSLGGQYSSATLKKVATDTWDLIGDLA